MSRSVKRGFLRLALLSVIVFAMLAPGAHGSNAEPSADDNIERFAVKRVQPPYPPLAQKYKIEGLVVVQVLVDKDGKVGKAEFVSGNSLFRSVSLDAAKRWEFKRPEGDSLQGTIHFKFKLDS
ncbi:MAG TPA: TonB family protein [Blastocatellia bacterium]|nr:TonB family protein [Blastocatellia bacterium]